METILSEKQIQAYNLVSGEHENKSTAEAALEMSISPQAVNRLLKRAKIVCPLIFPILTKQEADVKLLLASGHNNYDLANKLGVSLGRISQIVNSLYSKRPHIASEIQPVKMVRYAPHLDNQIKRKF